MGHRENQIYKIGLTSTHGTGKTTLAYNVVGKLKERGIKAKPIGEFAGLAKERGIPINLDTTLAAQGWILFQQCLHELEGSIYKYDVIVCDRTVFDNYCYLENALGGNDFFLNMALGYAKTFPYNRLYLLPITIKPTRDGIRDLDLKFQEDIDQKLRASLKAHKIPFIELPKPENDQFREEWIEILVTTTMRDLG